jgi:hypothetical protein
MKELFWLNEGGKVPSVSDEKIKLQQRLKILARSSQLPRM